MIFTDNSQVYIAINPVDMSLARSAIWAAVARLTLIVTVFLLIS